MATKKKSERMARVEVALSAAQKREYEALAREIEDASRDEMRGWDRKWEAVGRILAKQLWVAAGVGSPDQWIAKVLKESRRTVYRNVKVARYASPDDEKRWGSALIDAVVAYLEAKHGEIDGRLPVRLEAVRIPVVRGGETKRLGLDELTQRDVNAATTALRRGKDSDRARPSPIEQALVEALKGDASLRAIRVRVGDGVVSLANIPLAHFDLALRILREADWEGARPIAKKRTSKASKKSAPRRRAG
ncbi:hypothetical protein [Sandaracinus amylolyticus]|uniref:Uncharacterized protein n=1 Tax=Sandaracinus amylolyticus TaxID=927083 RepID=A0A0F6W1I9_9BACT|nr:hypothetical protein [Sandaracinus amylolyticus]AKF05131.1 hypothetical protein DB32_002280 [Sandaracinus amylolyticus]